MNPKRKTSVITETGTEYGLCYWLRKEINDNDSLELELVQYEL
jgi:hypothetical protein